MKSTESETENLKMMLKSIGDKLIELRKQKGYLSSVDFAKDFDLPTIQYWRMEKGRTNMTLKSLHKILTIHSMNIEELFVAIAKQRKKSK